MAAAKAAEAMVMVLKRGGGGGVAMAKMRVKVDLGCWVGPHCWVGPEGAVGRCWVKLSRRMGRTGWAPGQGRKRSELDQERTGGKARDPWRWREAGPLVVEEQASCRRFAGAPRRETHGGSAPRGG
jgi:hypothetical protein